MTSIDAETKAGEKINDTSATSAPVSDSENGASSPEIMAASDIYIDPVEERKALRKFDMIVLPQVRYSTPRKVAGNAKVFGFATDLNLKGNQFGNISTLFYVPYILLETPWVMAVKYYGPNKVLAVALICWSIVTISTGFIHTYGQAVAVRMLLGVCEAGVAPGFAFIFSTIWDRKDTAKRVALIYFANVMSGAFGGLFAYGIQSMGSRRGIAAWRWLFIIEGAVSLFVCGGCWFSFPNSPENAWFLNAREKEIMALRKQRDVAYKGDDEFSWKWAKLACTDPFIYAASLSFFCSSVAIFGFGTFLPTIIKGLGFNDLQANYLTIPVYMLGGLNLCVCAYFSDKTQNRGIFLFTLPIPVIVGYIIAAACSVPGVGYFAMFVCCCGIYTFNALILTWVTINLQPDYKRSVGVPFFVSLGNLSGLVASQLYPSSQSPRYVMGNAVSAGMETLALLIVVGAWWILRRRNQLKDKLIAEGVTDNGLEGDMALDFKYAI
ncbi:high-affinity nicotinic acid transporter-2 [Coleophoma crateriformis]|uniref:High-affinity nicotinic acid transporter-2 n=1 Tax=Coleophoma crateriformis TaxID=565419 RepID=A0A3D8QED9_9HELO|nr:high-affinity nicotinic acid transporter-2 [Coleophoma crateriformis]